MPDRKVKDYQNNCSPLPRASILKRRWQRFMQGLPKPPTNG
jgi:N-acyl-phosphatidylethanolamine-hydrolysing phospholipase D